MPAQAKSEEQPPNSIQQPQSQDLVLQLRLAYNLAIKQHCGRASTPAALLSVLLHAGSALAAALVAGNLLNGQHGGVAVGAALLAILWIGTRFRALGNMLHECAHGTLATSRRLNHAIGHVLGIIDFTSFERYIQEHRTHHQYLGDPTRDLDFAPRVRFGFANASKTSSIRHVLLPLSLFHVFHYLRPVLFDVTNPRWVKVGRWAYLIGLISLAEFVVGWRSMFLFYWVPYLTVYQVLRYWSDAADHAGIIASADEFQRTRNHLLPWRWLEFLMLPRNDAYHLVHHLFPNVPTCRYPEAHRVLLADSAYASRQHSLFARSISAGGKS